MRSVIRNLILFAQNTIIYPLLATFGGGDQAAPLPSPLGTPAVENGLLYPVQIDGSLSVASGKMTWTPPTTPAHGDLGFYGKDKDGLVFTRVTGLAYSYNIVKNTSTDFYPTLAWHNLAGVVSPAANQLVIYLDPLAQIRPYDGNGTPIGLPYAALVEYELVLVADSVGGKAYVRGGLYPGPEFTLVRAMRRGAQTATFYPTTEIYSGTGTLDRVQVQQLAGDLATDTGAALSYVVSPTNGQIIIIDPDGQIDFTWTAATGETLDIEFRRVDSNNCYIVRCIQASSRMYIYGKVAGVETELGGYVGGVAQTFTNGSVYRLSIQLRDESIYVDVDGTGTLQCFDNVINITANTGKVSGFATGAKFTAWKGRLSIPEYPYTPKVEIMAIGDSKTMATYSWHSQLIASLGSYSYSESVQIGKSGAATVSIKNNIDAYLSIRSGNPSYVLYNLGANDVPSMPVEATFKSNMTYILDAIHAKYPNALIYITDCWRQGYDTECNTIAGWNSDVRATRSFTRAGDNERGWLKGADNGATNTLDGIHYSAAGNIAKAAQAKLALGL